MKDKLWKVYKHVSPSNKVYIGITSKSLEERCKNGYGYLNKKNGRYVQSRFANAINKYGWENFEHYILFENLTKEEAEEKEIELISLYKSTNEKYGYNLSIGGGVPFQNRTHSDNTKKMISDKLKTMRSGELNPMYGKVSPTKGIKFSEDRKKSMSEISKRTYQFNNGIKESVDKSKRKVNQYDMNGNLLNTFDSIRDAYRYLEVYNMKGNIEKVCKRYRNSKGSIFKSYKGFQWRYVEDCEDISIYTIRKSNHSKQSKKICEIDKNGNIIGEYNSIAECSKILGLNPSGIGQVCLGNYSTTKGHIFRYI